MLQPYDLPVTSLQAFSSSASRSPDVLQPYDLPVTRGGAQTVRNTYKYLPRASPRQRAATNLVYSALEFTRTLVICPQFGASPRTARHGTRQRLRPSLSARRGARQTHATPVRPVNHPARQPNRRRSMGHLRCPQTHSKCFVRRVFLASGGERDHSKI